MNALRSTAGSATNHNSIIVSSMYYLPMVYFLCPGHNKSTSNCTWWASVRVGTKVVLQVWNMQSTVSSVQDIQHPTSLSFVRTSTCLCNWQMLSLRSNPPTSILPACFVVAYGTGSHEELGMSAVSTGPARVRVRSEGSTRWGCGALGKGKKRPKWEGMWKKSSGSMEGGGWGLRGGSTWWRQTDGNNRDKTKMKAELTRACFL